MIAIDHGGRLVAFLLSNGEGDKKIMRVLLMEEGGGICRGRLGDCGGVCPINGLLKMLPPLTMITLLMPTTAPSVLKTRCQIWGTIELHRDPILKVLSVC